MTVLGTAVEAIFPGDNVAAVTDNFGRTTLRRAREADYTAKSAPSETVTIQHQGKMTVEALMDAIHHLGSMFHQNPTAIRVSSRDYDSLRALPEGVNLTITGLSIYGTLVLHEHALDDDEYRLLFLDGTAAVRRVIGKAVAAQ